MWNHEQKKKVCMEGDKCKDRYRRAFTEETVIAPTRYPVYRRIANKEPVQV